MRIASSRSQRAQSVGIGGIFRRFEAHLHMALRREIVDLVGLRFLNDPDDIGRIRHVPVMQEERRRAFMRIDVEMIDSLGIKRGCASLHAMDDVIAFQKQFRQIAAVLAGDASDQRGFATVCFVVSVFAGNFSPAIRDASVSLPEANGDTGQAGQCRLQRRV